MCTRLREAFAAVLALLLWASAGEAAASRLAPAASDAPDFRRIERSQGPTLRLESVDIALSASRTPPTSGWVRMSAPVVLTSNDAAVRSPPPNAWGRFRFDRGALPPGSVSMVLDHAGERMIVYLNGVDVFRNYGADDEVLFAWNRPWLVRLPERLLKPTGNEVLVRMESSTHWKMGLGIVELGSDREVQRLYGHWNLVQQLGPRIINATILIFTLGAAIGWATRPKEPALGWLVLVGALWFVRNLHYYVDRPPFDTGLFWAMTVYSLLALMVALYGFAATFVDVPHRKRVIAAFALAGAGLAGLRVVLLQTGTNDWLVYLLTFPLSVAVVGVLAWACLRGPSVDKLAMLGAIVLGIGFSNHDLFVSSNVGRNGGVGFYLQPYSSLIVFGVFAASLFRRMLAAMGEVETLNASLEERVADAAERLRRSEAARRELEVAAAVEGERERMMREIHDGVGSSLVTALAVAQSKPHGADTAAVLRGALADLRLAVDSLEPIEGDVVALIASLRHRLEPDLNRAGIVFVWEVEPVPRLPWLDAVGALHILRILQEAIGNVLTHAGASQIAVACRPSAGAGANGIEVVIADNGRGFEPEARVAGRGLANMRARAEALSAELSLGSAPGGGSRITLWLPPSPPFATPKG